MIALLAVALSVGDASECRFAFYADPHGSSRQHRMLVDLLIEQDPYVGFEMFDAVIVGGDIDPRDDYERDVSRLMDLYDIRFAQGNHDPVVAPYEFVCGDVQIVVLPWSFGQRTVRWIESATEDEDTKKVLVMHQPLLPCAVQRMDDVRPVLYRQLLEPVLDRFDVVLSGHDHVLCERNEDGIDQWIAGSGGSKFYECASSLEENAFCIDGVNSFLVVESTGGDLLVSPVIVYDRAEIGWEE